MKRLFGTDDDAINSNSFHFYSLSLSLSLSLPPPVSLKRKDTIYIRATFSLLAFPLSLPPSIPPSLHPSPFLFDFFGRLLLFKSERGMRL